MDKKIQEIRTALAEATPGPWVYQQGGYARNAIVYQEKSDDLICIIEERLPGNGDFIANAPEYISYLLQQVDIKDKTLKALVALKGED